MTVQPNALQFKWLLATLAVILALHSVNLPIWVVIISVLFGSWRYMMLRQQWPMPKLYVLAPITLLIGLGILLTFGGQLGRDTSLSLMVSMLSLKLLETKSRRDFILVIMLGYFVVGNLFIFDQSMLVFLLSMPPLVLLTAVLLQLNVTQDLSPLKTVLFSAKMLLQAVPFMLVLFVLFPRIPGPLWSLPQDAHASIGLPGLSDSIQLNQMSQNAQDNSVAFRVKFKGKIPAQHQLYWRGPVLWITENNQWEISHQAGRLPTEPLAPIGQSYEYSLTLEPHNQKWLLMLDMPQQIPEIASLTHDYSAVAKEPVVTRIRYEAQAYSNYQLGGQRLGKREKNMALQLEDGVNPRTQALGEQWKDLNAEDTIQQALKLFKQQDFYYTLNPPPLGQHPLDDFLFKTKRGFCEHYAVSFVTLMRAAGLPARVVTGYQGGELNPHDQFLIIRQMDAHAWAEVWLKNRGWVRVDPTAAVSPTRVERGLVEAVQSARVAPGETNTEANHLPMTARRKQYPWLHQAMLRWDSVDNGWNQWVIGYNQTKQESLLSQLSGQKVTAQTLLIWLICAMFVLGLGTLLVIYHKNRLKLNKTQQLYQQLQRKLRRLNLQQHPQEGALDFAKRAAQALPHLREQLIEIAQIYNALQYSPYKTLADNTLIDELENRIKQFNPNA